MAAFHSCLEILFRPEGPEVILCSLSRAAPVSPSPALAPGTSLPVRRGGRRGGAVSRPFVPLVFPCAGLPLSAPCPQQLRQHTEGSGPRQQEQRFLQPSPQKRETLESLRKTVAFVAANPGPGCSPCVGAAAAARRGLPALPCVAAVAGPGPACSACAGAAGGCRRCGCSPLPPLPLVAMAAGPRAGAGDRLSRVPPGASVVAAGSPASRVATGAPARLVGRGHWHCARGGCGRSFCHARQHTEGAPAPGNKSNGPPQPSPKKENTGEACGNTLLLLPCVCRCCRCSRRSACCRVAAGAAALCCFALPACRC